MGAMRTPYCASAETARACAGGADVLAAARPLGGDDTGPRGGASGGETGFDACDCAAPRITMTRPCARAEESTRYGVSLIKSRTTLVTSGLALCGAMRIRETSGFGDTGSTAPGGSTSVKSRKMRGGFTGAPLAG